MKKLLGVGDAAAIGLSFLCALHCLVLPLVLALIPVMTSSLNHSDFHRWMVMVVVPVSVFSLIMGWRSHKQYLAVVIGSIGLLLLIFSGYFGEGVLNEFWEENLTVLAATIIAVGHLCNFRFCQRECRSPKNDFERV